MDLADLISNPCIADCIQSNQGNQERYPDRAWSQQLHEEQEWYEEERPAAAQLDAPTRGQVAIQISVERL